MKTPDEHNEAREFRSGQSTDAIASAVVTERERLMTDPVGQWCTQMLTRDISTASPVIPPHGGKVSGFSVPLKTWRSAAAIHLPGFPATLPSELIPRLDRITVRVAGSFPLMRGRKSPEEQVSEKYTPEPRIEPAVTPPPSVKKATSFAKAIVKVIPTREKRTRRKPETEVEPPIVAVPKPLKIIRRRKQEEPKVFETGPRTVPKAMLEGVSVPKDMEGNGQEIG